MQVHTIISEQMAFDWEMNILTSRQQVTMNDKDTQPMIRVAILNKHPF